MQYNANTSLDTMSQCAENRQSSTIFGTFPAIKVWRIFCTLNYALSALPKPPSDHGFGLNINWSWPHKSQHPWTNQGLAFTSKSIHFLDHSGSIWYTWSISDSTNMYQIRTCLKVMVFNLQSEFLLVLIVLVPLCLLTFQAQSLRTKTATLLAPEAASHHPEISVYQESFEQRLTRRLIDLFTSRYMREKLHHTFHFNSSSHICQDHTDS